MKVITSGKIPIKMWLTDIEEGALKQAENLSNLPFAFHHVAIMPDSHEGYGMPIGGVLATKNVIIPNAVGVDIGCGMSAFNTGRESKFNKKKDLEKIFEDIIKTIPVGFNHHSIRQDWDGFKDAPNIPVIKRELQAASYQLGTLGGGNHFIEIQEDQNGIMWLMLHSGSRNFGYQIANEYHNKAKKMIEKWYVDVPTDLSFLPIDTYEGNEYFDAMDYALIFARESRRRMMEVLIDLFSKRFGKIKREDYDVIDIHHNYAALENHFGFNVWVHRKGAVRASNKDTVIIPGSQGTKSYICEGLGNIDSFKSCSHGAGRKMGRKDAIGKLNLEVELKRMKGIVHDMNCNEDLQEAAGAYKDIDKVMEDQKDLVKIIYELKPLMVVKSKEKDKNRNK